MLFGGEGSRGRAEKPDLNASEPFLQTVGYLGEMPLMVKINLL